MIEYPKKTSIDDFSPFVKDAAVRYGLPRETLFCKLCVESNQRPSTTLEHRNVPGKRKDPIKFDDGGICSACRFAELKRNTNWQLREEELIEVCAKNRRSDGTFDCLVPGSGGKDSIYAAHLLKYKYGMHPLTVTWAPTLPTTWGQKNFRGWLNSGQDNITITPNPKTHRLLTRLALDNLFHPFQPFILGQKSMAPKLASQLDINLIFYGEHEAEYGSPIENDELRLQNSSYFSSVVGEDLYFGGVNAKNLTEGFGLEKSDLRLYWPADQNLIEEKNIETHYLGYYLKWHPQGAYYFARDQAGFEPAPERSPGSYNKYSSIDDKFDDLHYYTTAIKFGRGRATEDASQEIRNGEITREEGVGLVHKYDLEFPSRFIPEMLEYLTISPEEFSIAHQMFEEPKFTLQYFHDLTDASRSPHLWKYENTEWVLRNRVT